MSSLARLAPLFAVAALAASAAPTLAQGGTTTYFSAELAQPASEAQFAAGGVVWHCEGTTCRAAQSSARALRVCTGLRREAGQVVSFAVAGSAIESDVLARCNG
jgi:hypothetical protein